MKQNEYNVNIISRNRLIFVMVLILCLSTIILKNYTPRIENKFLSVSQFLLVYAISFYIASLVSSAKIKVILTDEGILHIWKRRFLFSREKNITIPWDIVANYNFESDKTCDSIIINLTNKTKYKINKLNILPINDDFRKLENEFLKLCRRTEKEAITAHTRL